MCILVKLSHGQSHLAVSGDGCALFHLYFSMDLTHFLRILWWINVYLSLCSICVIWSHKYGFVSDYSCYIG